MIFSTFSTILSIKHLLILKSFFPFSSGDYYKIWFEVESLFVILILLFNKKFSFWLSKFFFLFLFFQLQIFTKKTLSITLILRDEHCELPPYSHTYTHTFVDALNNCAYFYAKETFYNVLGMKSLPKLSHKRMKSFTFSVHSRVWLHVNHFPF